MKYCKPDYFDSFSCSGSACTDTCCSDWEIEIDETTADYYESVSGEFGDRLKKTITHEENEHYFSLVNGRCPFLNDNNLCDIFINIGEEHLCDICREHPRFYNWFADHTECGLGMCCEEAQKLIFAKPDKTRFITYESDDADDTGADEAAEELAEMRSRAIEILQNREKTISERLESFLEYVLEYDQMDMPEDVCGASMQECMKMLLTRYSQLDALDPEWPKMLENMAEHAEDIIRAEKEYLSDIKDRVYEYEHLAVYFTYRYFPEIVFDADAAGHAVFAAASVLVIYFADIWNFVLSGNTDFEQRCRVKRRFSKETEYCPDNMEQAAAFISDNMEDCLKILRVMLGRMAF